MSSLRNAISRRAHKERAQPESRKKFGLLKKHKDYVERAKAYHKKEETFTGKIVRLKEKAAFRNPDEFYFKMIKTRTVDGVHKLENQANKYTPEELLLMKTQDIGYILQKVQSEKKKIEKLTATLHSLHNRPSSRHVYFAEDRLRYVGETIFCFLSFLGRLSITPLEAKEIQSCSKSGTMPASEDIPDHIKRKTTASYRELEARRNRVNELEKIYTDMAMQKELQKKGRKRELREDEVVCPTSKPVFKWQAERKR